MDAQEKFERSIDFSLKWEGGRNFNIVNGKPVIKGNAKADLGGATAYGITWPTLKNAYKAGIVSHDDICKLTIDEAKAIYRKNFWDRYGWEELTWPVCLCCLDCCINHGGFAFILQRAILNCGQPVVVDGKFGPKTFAALKAYIQLCLAMSQLAKELKHASPKPQQRENEKYAFRCWMLRLGFIGDEFKTARTLLLKNVSGNGAWRS